ncbi:MAG: Unknown protein [uncultured Sulfurovum sp.]|uniref:Uncharacterized protein n=1 Tax=uncultured Sulfurovum sp. TaxID=269237 RepID=A0A6S6TIG7_9BACT|nr:MAG: Unknown protein [uncultured Sulfurovum sp.]
MPNVHDPYLDTARRSLTEKQIIIRKKKSEEIQAEKKGFFSKNIIVNDYIALPEGLETIILFAAFIIIPYMVGVMAVFIIMGYEQLQKYTTFDFDLFMLSWTIGYETIAILLLIGIIKSAFTFKQKSN